MKKQFFYFIFFAAIFSIACNNSGKKEEKTVNTGDTGLADSLMQQVMDGHNEGMAKYGKIRAMQTELNRLVDSIDLLTSKSKEAVKSWKASLEDALNEVNSAKSGMDAWMESFNMDSAVNNIKERIKYLTEEKLKVDGIGEAIRKSLSKADSVLKMNH